jgi:ceramide glucosyltransferase
LTDQLADDYQLGNRIAAQGGAIVISPLVVECRETPKNWRDVWTHQLRWARTIRVCRPVPYFFSILGNGTLWPLIWLLLHSVTLAYGGSLGAIDFVASRAPAGVIVGVFLAIRVWTARDSQSRLTGSESPHASFWLVPIKDLLGTAIWAASFLGSHLEWRGYRYRVDKDGRLTLVSKRPEHRVSASI